VRKYLRDDALISYLAPDIKYEPKNEGDEASPQELHRLHGRQGAAEKSFSAHAHDDVVGLERIAGRALQFGNRFVEVCLRAQLVAACGRQGRLSLKH
jgi:hypothetical protein